MNDLIEKVNNMRWGGKYTTEDIIAIVREHDAVFNAYVAGEDNEFEPAIRADERQRCIDAVKELLERNPNGLVNYGITICLEALEKQE